MVPEMELELGMFRQLDVQSDCNPNIEKNSGSSLESGCPPLMNYPIIGVKADAIPGRVNQLNFISVLPGVLYGQCSEICGRQHSNMPICLEMLRLKDFNT